MVKLKYSYIGLVALLCYVFAAAAQAAEITARTDRANIGLDESFTLTFEATGSVDAEPDFDPLTRDFDIISTRQSSRVNIVNGQMSRRKTWTLELFPKREGDITIPAIGFGADKSPELKIHVGKKAAADAAPADKDIFLKVEADPAAPYVQQQVQYTIRLYRGVPTNNAKLSEPELSHSNAVLRQLDQDRNYETVLNGRRYQVFERRYVIFPQDTGPLRIRPVQFTAVVSDRGNRSFGFGAFGQNGKRVRQQSDTVELDVRPPPDAFTGRHWLPAESLQLSENWSPQPPVFKVGEPVTRTLTLAANGLTAAQLPELAIDVPAGIKQYPDRPDLQDDADNGGVLGQRTEKIALIPTRAGRHTLPAVEVAWWNTQSGAMETARLPERTINVAAAPGAQPPAAPPDQTTDRPTDDRTADGQTGDDDEQAAEAQASGTGEAPGYWPWLAALLGAGWLATAGWWWRRERRNRQRNRQQSDTQRAAQNARQALRRVEQACRNNDPEATKAALIDWGRALWPEAGIHNLSALARQLDPNARGEIQSLNDFLYRGQSGEWHGEALWRAVRECKAVKGEDVDDKGDGLEPLHKI